MDSICMCLGLKFILFFHLCSTDVLLWLWLTEKVSNCSFLSAASCNHVSVFLCYGRGWCDSYMIYFA